MGEISSSCLPLGVVERERIAARNLASGIEAFFDGEHLGTGGLTLESSSEPIRAKLNGAFLLAPEATAPFDFEVVYVPSSVPIAFIQMRPAAPLVLRR